MNTLNRVIPPEAKAIQNVRLNTPEHNQLSNGLDLYTYSAGTQEVVKIELVFEAGSSSNDNPLIPGFAVSMLSEGTSSKSAIQIAEAIDDYGAFLETDLGKDFTSVTLITLSRFLPETLPVLIDVIRNSTIPEREFEIKRTNRKQKYLVGLEKVGFVAGKRFQEILFQSTGYGATFNENSYDQLNRQDVLDFYQKNFKNSPFRIYMSGFLSIRDLDIVKTEFSTLSNFKINHADTAYSSIDVIKPIKEIITRDNAMQSAVRIGRKLFTRAHPDYFGMKVLCTILGGYFGSRLMTNIREDKGYTYGIGAGMVAMNNDGYFYISTEVGVDVCADAISEIYKEIEQLQKSAVLETELNLVKNYMLGSLLKSFEGPFERMERFKLVHLHGFDVNYYEDYSDAIRSTSASQLLGLANKWLKKEDLVELVVGKK
ncbi:MAG: pitrilysin family protein [Bacteroidia bacterium]